MIQCNSENPMDWTSTVMKDIKELNINMTFLSDQSNEEVLFGLSVE